MAPVRVQIVTIDEFAKLYEERKFEILSARILPPVLGNKDFGKIMIEWKNPVFMPVACIDDLAFA